MSQITLSGDKAEDAFVPKHYPKCGNRLRFGYGDCTNPNCDYEE